MKQHRIARTGQMAAVLGLVLGMGLLAACRRLCAIAAEWRLNKVLPSCTLAHASARPGRDASAEKRRHSFWQRRPTANRSGPFTASAPARHMRPFAT